MRSARRSTRAVGEIEIDLDARVDAFSIDRSIAGDRARGATAAEATAARAMKAARTKAALKHLKTKRKRAKDKRKRRAARAASDAATAMAIDGALATGEGGGGEDEDDDDGRATTRGGDGDAGAGAGAGRMKQSAITARKRELRERIAELKSKRGKIGKKNFGKSEERKRLTLEIKKLERERASVCASTANAGGAIDEEEEDLVRADEDAEMVM